jgi:beta-mannosidase
MCKTDFRQSVLLFYTIMKKTILSILILCKSIVYAQNQNQDLGTGDWFFKEHKNTNWRPAQVPGCVHTDLMANKALADPFWRDNEKWVQWVSNMDWDYKTTFELSPEMEAKQNISLVFKGLDTYAEVVLNGKSLLTSDNMFLTHRLDVKSLLKKGKNELLVKFQSPLKAALPDLVANQEVLPAINDAMALKTSPFTRKAGYHYGWDWGPRLVTSGIWRPVFLEGWDQVRIENVFLFTQKIEKGTAFIQGEVKLVSSKKGPFKLEVQMDDQTKTFDLPDTSKTGKHRFSFKLGGAKLWWSNGLANSHLYNLQVKLSEEKNLLDSYQSHFGVRTIDLIQDKDKDGKSFYLKLNGRPVFMKGANYIPQDNFLSRVSPQQCKKLLLDVKNSHMNMLRVWGGGIYESDWFYKQCDSLGILVWQDFMFACAMYPGTEKFRKSVAEEVKQNVQRLRNFASIALWCGNNENETGWFKKWIRGGIPYGPADSSTLYQDHIYLFHKMIPEIVKAEDPSRAYTRSSPSANDDQIKPDKIGFGDIHDWNVWFGTGDYRAYAKTVSRFQSEYGYQSFPEMSSIRKFSETQDWFEDSDVMDVHQKHPNGNSKIKRFSSQFYQTPADFESFLYVSQLQQAEAMKFAIETHRSKMPYCMGSLYWQLNDCWPAASWSSIDYYGKWKATQYFAKKAFAPVLVSSRLHKDSIKISLVNESQKAREMTGFEMIWRDFSGKEMSRQEMVLPKQKLNDNQVGQYVFQVKKLNWSKKDSSSMYLELNTLGAEKVKSHYFYRLPKDLILPQATVSHSIEKTNTGYLLKVKSGVLIKNLFIATTRGNFHVEDNYFDLFPQEEKTIELIGTDNLSNEDVVFKFLNPKTEN